MKTKTVVGRTGIAAPPPKKVSTAVVVANLEKRAKSPIKKLKKITKIKTQKDFDLAGEQVKLLKELAKEAEAQETGMTKPMLDGVKESVRRIKEHFEPFHEKIDSLEEDIKSKMMIFLAAQKAKQGQIETKFNLGTVSVGTYAKQVASTQVKNGAAKVKRPFQLFIDNPEKIQREFLVPNESAIREAFKAGKKVAGCRWEQVETIAI